jgi:hypothetical protein
MFNSIKEKAFQSRVVGTNFIDKNAIIFHRFHNNPTLYLNSKNV